MKKRKIVISFIMAVAMGACSVIGNVSVGYAMEQENDSSKIMDVQETNNEKVDDEKIASIQNPVIDASTEEVTFSYVYFGSYPQSEVSGEALTQEIIKADYSLSEIVSNFSKIEGINNYAISGEAIVMGEKYRRMVGEDGSYKYFKYEPIKWRVMSVKGNEALLRTDIAIDSRRYDNSSKSKLWVDNELRQWLNGYSIGEETFLDSAFTKDEMLGIVDRGGIPYTSPGSSAELYYNDKVMLWEYDDTFTQNSLMTEASDYAWNRGVMSGKSDDKYVNWWLQDYGTIDEAAYINTMGEVCDHEIMCNCGDDKDIEHKKKWEQSETVGVCPTVTLKLDSTNFWKTVEEQENQVSKDSYNITNISNYKYDFKVNCEAANTCRLVIALYDENGRMYTFGTTEVQKGQSEVIIRTEEVPGQGSYTVKAFLMNLDNNEPLCKAYSEYMENIGVRHNGKCGENVYYTLHYDGTLELYGQGATYNYERKNESPFNGNTSIRKIVIGEGIQRIGSYLFKDTTKLNEVIFSETVMEIGNSVFANCTSMEEIVLPKALDNLSVGMFMGCTNLKKVQWPDDLKMIGMSAFDGCENLEYIEIPDTVTVLGSAAFYECYALKSIHLSDNLKKIEANTFYDCDSLKSLVIPESVTVIDEAFPSCNNLVEIQFSQNVVDIGTEVFSSTEWFEKQRMNKEIESILAGNTLLMIRANEEGVINVPDGVTAIAGGVFEGDNGIIKIPSSVVLFNEDTFKGIGEAAQIYVVEDSYAEIYLRSIGRAFYIEKEDGSIEVVSNEAVEMDVVSYSELKEIDSDSVSEITEEYLDEQNSVFVENANDMVSAKVQNKQAKFCNVVTDVEYLLLIVKDESKPMFSKDNLLYIDQYTSNSDGRTTFVYLLDEDVEDYVVYLFTDTSVKPIYADDILLGDVNGDKQVTLVDAQLALRMALNIQSISMEQLWHADMDADDSITLTDAQRILRIALKID